MMPKASETLSHQPFCLIIKINKRTGRVPSLALLKESIPLADPLCRYLSSYYHNLLTHFCLSHLPFICQRWGKLPQSMDFLHKIVRMVLNVKKMFCSTNPCCMCKNYMCSTSRQKSSKSSIKFSTLLPNLLEDSEKPL